MSLILGPRSPLIYLGPLPLPRARAEFADREHMFDESEFTSHRVISRTFDVRSTTRHPSSSHRHKRAHRPVVLPLCRPRRRDHVAMPTTHADVILWNRWAFDRLRQLLRSTSHSRIQLISQHARCIDTYMHHRRKAVHVHARIKLD